MKTKVVITITDHPTDPQAFSMDIQFEPEAQPNAEATPSQRAAFHMIQALNANSELSKTVEG